MAKSRIPPRPGSAIPSRIPPRPALRKPPIDIPTRNALASQDALSSVMRATGMNRPQLMQLAANIASQSGAPPWLTSFLRLLGGQHAPAAYADTIGRQFVAGLEQIARQALQSRGVAPVVAPGGGGRGVSPPAPPQPPGGSPPVGPSGQGGFRPAADRGRGVQQAPPLPGEESQNPLSNEILTPQSSNVFSFAYDYATSTLYVTYKAPQLNHAGVSQRSGAFKGRAELHGKNGSTLKGKSNERGPLYAYLDVPARVYDRMRSAVSKGKFVWDELRVRGTVYGHKYRYTLVQGATITQGKHSGVYVPRKATRRGFMSRTLSDIGRGRRGFTGSTIEPRFFKNPRGRHSLSARGMVQA